MSYDVRVKWCKTILQLITWVAPVELAARIVTLRLAETFVISRESSDEDDVVQVELRHDGVTGFGEGAPIERYARSKRSRTSRSRAAPRRRPVRARGDRGAPAGGRTRPGRRSTAPCTTCREAARRARLEAARAAADRPADLLDGWLGDPDDMARAPRGGAAVPPAQAEAGRGRRLDVERVRAVRAVTDLPLMVDVNEWWSLEEALEALPQLASSVSSTASSRSPPATGAAGRWGALADPDLRRRGLPPARRRGAARRSRTGSTSSWRSRAGSGGGANGACARALGLGVMLGCMIESGLGIAAGCIVAPLCDHVDLDGNLLIADDPWPGVAFADGVQVPSERPGLGVAAAKVLILAEGFSGDPHYGKTARGVLAYGERPVVALVDSARAGSQGRRADRRHRRGCARPRTDDRAGRGRDGRRRFPPAWRDLLEDAIGAGLHVENRPAPVPPRRPGAGRARASARRRAARPAAPSADLNVPTGANLETGAKHVLTVGSDCAIGKMTVSLELDRAARARGVESFHPDRADRDRDRGVGDRRRRGRVRLPRRRCGTARRRRPGAGRRAALRRGPGRHHPPRLLRRHPRPDPRLGAACVRALPPGRDDGGRGLPGHPLLPLPELVELHERISLTARKACGGNALNTRGLSDDAARAAIARAEAETGLPADDPVRSGADRILRLVLAALD